jgi:hypothetical protein
MHLGIPPDVWQPFCPFRTLRETEFPAVSRWITRFARWQRYQVLPEVGGLDDQDEQTLRAFDLMTNALALPRVPLRPE